MTTNIQFDITQDEEVLQDFRKAAIDERIYSGLKRQDIENCIEGRKRYEKRLNTVIRLDKIIICVNALIGSGIIIALLIR